MTQKAVKVGPVATGTDLRNPDLAINSDNIRLEALRVQYLSEVFALPSSAAAVIAELAFGGAR